MFSNIKHIQLERPLTITVGNQKGGSGKTTIIRYVTYALAKAGYKILLLDLDPQHDLTDSEFITRTLNHKESLEYNQTLMTDIAKGNTDDSIINIMDNLDIIPSYKDLKRLDKYLGKKYGMFEPTDHDYINKETQKRKVVKDLIQPIKNNYDFVFIDTPPTSSDWTRTALYASDYILVVLQTQADSLKDARDYINDDITETVNVFNVDTDIIGVLPNEFSRKGAVDRTQLEEAKKVFGEDNVFKNIFRFAKASQSSPLAGITIDTYWDKQLFNNIVIPITNELLDRIAEVEDYGK